MTPNPTVPRDFEEAYEDLVELVGSVSRGEISHEALPEKVDEWRAAGCRGSATLAGAALRALRYELASRGFEEGPEAVSEDLQALSHVEVVLEPGPATESQEPDFSRSSGCSIANGGNEASEIVEVALAQQLREAMPNGKGFKMGEIQIIFEPTQGPPHGHMSVSHPNRYPTYEELSRAARAPGGNQPNLWMWLPKPDEAQARQPNTVHLYVVPPEELLG
jgi:hypothetical protein